MQRFTLLCCLLFNMVPFIKLTLLTQNCHESYKYS